VPGPPSPARVAAAARVLRCRLFCGDRGRRSRPCNTLVGKFFLRRMVWTYVGRFPGRTLRRLELPCGSGERP
jgi:hypothetical protein